MIVTSTGWPARALAAESPPKPAPTMATRCIGPWWHTSRDPAEPSSPEVAHRLGTLAAEGPLGPSGPRGGLVMITGLVLGLVAGVALGLAVGLLVRSNQVTAARTAEARLADALDQQRLLTEELQGLRAQLIAEQQRVVALQAEASRLATELNYEREAASQRAASFDEVRDQLLGEFARLSTAALQQNSDQFLQLADTKLNDTRQAADGELAKRQEAIEQLLADRLEQLLDGLLALGQLPVGRLAGPVELGVGQLKELVAVLLQRRGGQAGKLSQQLIANLVEGGCPLGGRLALVVELRGQTGRFGLERHHPLLFGDQLRPKALELLGEEPLLIEGVGEPGLGGPGRRDLVGADQQSHRKAKGDAGDEAEYESGDHDESSSGPRGAQRALGGKRTETVCHPPGTRAPPGHVTCATMARCIAWPSLAQASAGFRRPGPSQANPSR